MTALLQNDAAEFIGVFEAHPARAALLQGHGLSMSEVLQTQAIFALTIALCEVPSGYIADIWGRRGAILAGAALNAVQIAETLINRHLKQAA